MQAQRYHERISDISLPRILTAVTDNRLKYFTIPKLAELAYNQIIWAAKHHNVRLYAFTVMTNHVHAVADNPGDKAIANFMHSFKRYVSREIGKWHNEIHGIFAKAGLLTPPSHIIPPFDPPPVWQASFHEKLIYSQSSLMTRIEYVANNAVKHGVVKKREDYPWTYVAPECADMVST